MNELTLTNSDIRVNLGSVEFPRLEEAKAQASEIVKRYENIVVTTDPAIYKEAKKQRTELKKSMTAIDDIRKEAKKIYIEPLDKFEAEIKGLEGIYRKAWQVLDKSVKEVEALQREERREKVEALIREHGVYGDGELIPLEDKWLNKSYSELNILKDIKDRVEKAEALEAKYELDEIKIKELAEEWGLEPATYILEYRKNGRIFSYVKDEMEEAKNYKEFLEAEKDETGGKEVTGCLTMDEVKQEDPKKEPEPEPEVLTVKLEIKGTLGQLQALANFMKTSGIRSWRI